MSTLTLKSDRICDAPGAGTGREEVWAAVWPGNLVHAVPEPREFAEAPRWVLWSGTPAPGLFDESPFIWGLPAWEKFEAALRAVAMLAGARKVLVRPHARHVMSDMPSCLRVLERTSVENARVLLDPAAMLTDDMRSAGAEDHVTRILEGLAGHPGVEAVVVGDEVVERVLARVWPQAAVVR